MIKKFKVFESSLNDREDPLWDFFQDMEDDDDILIEIKKGHSLPNEKFQYSVVYLKLNLEKEYRNESLKEIKMMCYRNLYTPSIRGNGLSKNIIHDLRKTKFINWISKSISGDLCSVWTDPPNFSLRGVTLSLVFRYPNNL